MHCPDVDESLFLAQESLHRIWRGTKDRLVCSFGLVTQSQAAIRRSSVFFIVHDQLGQALVCCPINAATDDHGR